MKKLMIVMGNATLLLLAGCGKEAAPETTPSVSIDVVTPTGAGDAVVPEEGDIIIPIEPEA